MPHYALTLQAKNSLKEIRHFSNERFGKVRTKRYLKDLKDRMDFLARNPDKGRKREDLTTNWNCYSYSEGRHLVFYEPHNDHIIIIDVLHQSMEPSNHI